MKVIDVSDLPEPLVDAIQSLVNTYRQETQSSIPPQKAPPIGWLKGKWELPESFFDPLPDEVLDLFEGDGERA